ncbi:hypothetical protein MYIN104542_30365 [Mycobacterium intermedium]
MAEIDTLVMVAVIGIWIGARTSNAKGISSITIS